jgi:deoxyribose-phosphate aldolase
LSGLLALFDLDGTLFLTHDPLSGRALRETLEEVYGIEVAANAPDSVEHRGLAAQRIARNVLGAAGLSDTEIDDRLSSWCSRYAERYLELLAASDTSGWEARPGAAEGLARLEAAGVRLALVTGNPEPVARARPSGSGSPASSRRVKVPSAARPRIGPSCSSSRGTVPETGPPREPPRSATHARTSRRRRPSESTRSRSPRIVPTTSSLPARTPSSATWTESCRHCSRSPRTKAPTRRRCVCPSDEGYTHPMSQAPALPTGFELPLEPRLPRIGSIDQVAVEARATDLSRRSIKREAKLFALDLAVRMMDLTTLEGSDTPGKVAALASKAVRPDPSDASVPSVAAVCVYPNLVQTARERVAGSGVKVASVATAFPSGQSPIDLKVAEARRVVELGADEVDMVIDRGAFLAGRYAKVYDEIVQVKEAVGDKHLKVILETGELGTYDNVRRASLLAIAAGADFIKTSTGKLSTSATMPVTLVMLEAIRDVFEETGRRVGMKPAGGIRNAKQAVQTLVLVHETLGLDWLTPDLFRFGASSLLNDVLMQIRKEKTGRYQSPDYFTID